MFDLDRLEWPPGGGREPGSEPTWLGLPDGVGGQSVNTGDAAPAVAAGLLLNLLDEISFGVAIVDPRCRLMHANRAARRYMALDGCVHVLDSRVRARRDDDAESLRRAVAAAGGGFRSYLSLRDGKGAVGVAILPACSGVGESGRAVALVLERADCAGGLGIYFFARSCGLTNAEQRVLSAVSDGSSVEEVACQLGCAVSTVRTHVRAVLQKTEQATLRELIASIGRLPPIECRPLDCTQRTDPDGF